MRYLDLAIAALVGTSAIAGIAAYSPSQGDLATSSLTLESLVRDALLAILQEKGIPWFVQSPPGTVCSYLHGSSNSSITFSGNIGTDRCTPSPPSGLTVVTLVLHLVPYSIVLEAWESDRA